MKVACDCASDILARIKTMIQPGMTTGEVDAYAAQLIKEHDARSAFLGYRVRGRRFPGNICIGVNDEVVHGIGGDRKIQNGDIVKVDVGVHKNGWVGDNATTIAVGRISPEAEKLLVVTRESLFRGIEKARAGNRLREVSRAIQDYCESHGMSIVKQYVGHGVGRKLHEEPQVKNFVERGSSPRLKPGMVLAIEPMVNFGGYETYEMPDGWTVRTTDGSLSAHFEHSVLVTDDEPVIMTYNEGTTLRESVTVPSSETEAAA